MSSDIGRFGASDDVGFYWIEEEQSIGNLKLSLIAIDGVGQVTRTGLELPHDPAAMTEEVAVAHHLAGPVRQADADLQRRRKEYEENPPKPKPAPADPATEKFYYDPEW